MLQLINSGSSVSLVAVTADLNRGIGGQRIYLEHAIRVGSKHSTKKNGTISVKESHKPDAHPIPLHTALIEKINGRTVL